MLTEAFAKLQNKGAVRRLNRFFRSPQYAAIVVLLMVFSELCSFEIAVYYCYLVLAVLALLFDEDTLSLVPIACCCYMTISAPNNSGKFPDTALTVKPEFTAHLIFIFAAVFVLLAARLITKLMDGEKRGAPKLTAGFFALGVAYVAAGAFSGNDWLRSVLFGVVQTVTLCGLYLYFFYTVNWKNVSKEYILTFMTLLGVGIAAEIVGMYLLPGAIKDGAVDRGAMFVGWGIYNNIGCVMTMCLPAPFYFAATRKHGWAYAVLGTLFMVAVVLSQSRGAILFGAVVYFVCAAVTFACAKGIRRTLIFVVYLAVWAGIAVSLLLFKEKLSSLFDSLINVGLNGLGRIPMYKACWEKFLNFPIFGAGFYDTPGGIFYNGQVIELQPTPDGVFLPPLAHNTVFQLLASGGAFALFAYGCHRIQTLVMFFRRPNKRKTYAFFCILGLLFTSLLDCHLFLFGPALLYSTILVFAEHGEEPLRKTLAPKK